jgi:hypothetical protein
MHTLKLRSTIITRVKLKIYKRMEFNEPPDFSLSKLQVDAISMKRDVGVTASSQIGRQCCQMVLI